MAGSTNYPTALDVFGDEEDYVDAGHPGTLANADDINDLRRAIEAAQVKLGKDGSSDTSSIDHILKNTSAGHDHDGSNSKTLSAVGLIAIQHITKAGDILLGAAGFPLDNSSSPKRIYVEARGVTIKTEVTDFEVFHSLGGTTATHDYYAHLTYYSHGGGESSGNYEYAAWVISVNSTRVLFALRAQTSGAGALDYAAVGGCEITVFKVQK